MQQQAGPDEQHEAESKLRNHQAVAQTGRLAGSVMLCGVAAMILIETVKRLLPLRGRSGAWGQW